MPPTNYHAKTHLNMHNNLHYEKAPKQYRKKMFMVNWCARTYLPNIRPNFFIYKLQFIKVVYFPTIIYDFFFSYDCIKEIKLNSVVLSINFLNEKKKESYNWTKIYHHILEE